MAWLLAHSHSWNSEVCSLSAGRWGEEVAVRMQRLESVFVSHFYLWRFNSFFLFFLKTSRQHSLDWIILPLLFIHVMRAVWNVLFSVAGSWRSARPQRKQGWKGKRSPGFCQREKKKKNKINRPRESQKETLNFWVIVVFIWIRWSVNGDKWWCLAWVALQEMLMIMISIKPCKTDLNLLIEKKKEKKKRDDHKFPWQRGRVGRGFAKVPHLCASSSPSVNAT